VFLLPSPSPRCARRCPGESGYLPLEPEAANLLFALVARRYKRGSIIVTSNRGFEAWGEILGDAMVAAALIDRLVQHAHIVTSGRR
jgi:DNA replication protein DnaC